MSIWQRVLYWIGLSPYTSKANILPEQTIGRGLRLMFRELASDYTEPVDVIGNKAFIEFVEDLEREEEIAFGTFEVGKDKLVINTIYKVQISNDNVLLFGFVPRIIKASNGAGNRILASPKSQAERVEKL